MQLTGSRTGSRSKRRRPTFGSERLPADDKTYSINTLKKCQYVVSLKSSATVFKMYGIEQTIKSAYTLNRLEMSLMLYRAKVSTEWQSEAPEPPRCLKNFGSQRSDQEIK